MEIHHHQMQIDKQEEKQLNPPPPPNSSSTSSSPPYEFTFTVSLHPSAATNIPERNKPPLLPQFAAIDLSPADDIFFHGHLLPLHLLSHLSPRSSTNSLLDSFTLPIKELSSIHNHNNTRSFDDNEDRNTIKSSHHQESSLLEGKIRSEKPKQPFSVFGLPRWRKGDHNHHHHQQQHHHQEEHDHHHRRQKTKSKFDVSGVMQRYMRLIKPFLVSFRSKYRRGSMNANNPQQTIDHQRQHQLSFSGNLKVRRKKGYLMRGRRGEYSAPASMRNSPTNSGLLVQSGGSGNLTPTCNKSDSTMEELQAAIQAAIAHCKKSISKEDIS